MLKTIILYPFSLIYALIISIRNFMFDHDILKSKEFDFPIICVGNISVGGTGKTPHTEYIVSLLKNKYKTAVLSRGYKRKTKGFVLADSSSKSTEIGDEPKQIKQKFKNITVAVSEKRVLGIQKLIDSKDKPEVIILDDAFQHRYVQAGLSVLLIDYNRSILTDSYLPLGRLRDNPSQRHRANIIIITKSPKDVKPIEIRIMAKALNLFPYQTLYFTSLKYAEICPVFTESKILADKEMIEKDNYHCLNVSGIANPTLFEEYVESFCKNTTNLRFSDHHKYTAKDIDKIFKQFNSIKSEKKIVLTTEKDAVKFSEIENIPAELKQSMFYIPVEPYFLNDEEEVFENQILKYVEKDQTNFKFHTTERQY